MFSCPRCTYSLKAQSIKNGIIYNCPNNHGKSIGISIVKRLSPEFTKKLPSILSNFSSSQLNCPSCKNSMKGLRYSENDKKYELDYCQNCQLVWFDSFESSEVLDIDEKVSSLKKYNKSKRQFLEEKQKRDLENQRSNSVKTFEFNESDNSISDIIHAVLGLPKEVDGHGVSTFPIATLSIVLITSIISIIGFFKQDLIDLLAYTPSEFLSSPLSSLSTFLVHGGVMHLIGNMYFFYITSDNVEDYLGSLKFILLVILSTFAASLAVHLVPGNAWSTPHVGASGGVFGILIFYLLEHPKSKLRFLFIYFYKIFEIKVGMIGSLIYFIGYQIIGQQFFNTNVSYTAHLGGASAGFVMWLVWGRRDK